MTDLLDKYHEYRHNIQKTATVVGRNSQLYPTFRKDYVVEKVVLGGKNNVQPSKVVAMITMDKEGDEDEDSDIEDKCCLAEKLSGKWRRCHRKLTDRVVSERLQMMACIKKLPIAMDEEAEHDHICTYHWRMIKFARKGCVRYDVRLEAEETTMEQMQEDSDDTEPDTSDESSNESDGSSDDGMEPDQILDETTSEEEEDDVIEEVNEAANDDVIEESEGGEKEEEKVEEETQMGYESESSESSQQSVSSIETAIMDIFEDERFDAVMEDSADTSSDEIAEESEGGVAGEEDVVMISDDEEHEDEDEDGDDEEEEDEDEEESDSSNDAEDSEVGQADDDRSIISLEVEDEGDDEAEDEHEPEGMVEKAYDEVEILSDTDSEIREVIVDYREHPHHNPYDWRAGSPLFNISDQEEYEDDTNDMELYRKPTTGLNTLSAASLRRYRKFFHIPTRAGTSKLLMLAEVEDHFHSLPADSRATIAAFLRVNNQQEEEEEDDEEEEQGENEAYAETDPAKEEDDDVETDPAGGDEEEDSPKDDDQTEPAIDEPADEPNPEEDEPKTEDREEESSGRE